MGAKLGLVGASLSPNDWDPDVLTSHYLRPVNDILCGCVLFKYQWGNKVD